MPDIFVSPPSQDPEELDAKTDGEAPKLNEPQNQAPSSQPQKSERQEAYFPVPRTPSIKGPSSPLAALLVNPKGVHFQTQEKDEEVVLLLRAHWVTNVRWILTGSLMLLAPFIVSLVLLAFNLSVSIPTTIFLIGQIFWYLISIGYLFIHLLIWYFNAYLVTNERVLDIDFYHLTYKQVSSTRVERIQDVTFKVGGVMRSIFNYGDVFVQTAGEEQNFDFMAVPKPAIVVQKIEELMQKVRGTGL